MTIDHSAVIRLLGFPDKLFTPPQWLKDYDPDANDGLGAAEGTFDLGEAMVFDTTKAAITCWQQVSLTRPVRADGQPNRPLTAFTVEIMLMVKAQTIVADELSASKGDPRRTPVTGHPAVDESTQRLVGCDWGRAIGLPGDPPCPYAAVRRFVLHDGDTVYDVQACPEHADVITAHSDERVSGP